MDQEAVAAVVAPSTSAGSPGNDTQPPRTWQKRFRRALPALLSLVIVIGIFYYFLPQYADISQVWASMQRMSPMGLGVLVLAALWNLATYGLVMTSTMPGLTFPQAMVVTESSTAVSNTLPGGGAIGIGMSFAMYNSWGFSRSRSTVSLLVSGIWNNFAKLAMPVLALALLALSGAPSGGRAAAGLLGIAGLVGAVIVFTLMLRSERGARRFGLAAGRVASTITRPFGRPAAEGWDHALAKFRARTILLIRARWLWITAATVVSHVSLYLVLLLALRNLSVSDVSWVEVFAVFSFARLLTAIPITPGGLGIVEVALITGLSAAGGDRPSVVAAVLIFRALTYVLPVPLGIVTYAFWRRNHSWRRAPGTAPRTPLVPETTGIEDPLPRPRSGQQASVASDAESRSRRRAGPPMIRTWRDGILLAVGFLVLVLCSLAVNEHSVAGWERAPFRLVNNVGFVPFVVVWPIMQLGNFLAAPIFALLAAATRRFRLAAGILLGGIGTYYLAKVVKGLVTRGRPFELLNNVHIHGAAATGRGYLSGHAALVACIATLAVPYLGRRARRAVWAAVVLVCLARVYVAAHLPLDVVAGAALGVAVGGMVRLALGRPKPCS